MIKGETAPFNTVFFSSRPGTDRRRDADDVKPEHDVLPAVGKEGGGEQGIDRQSCARMT